MLSREDSGTAGPHPMLLYRQLVVWPTTGFLAEIHCLGFYRNQCAEPYLAKTIAVVRGKEFPFLSGANYANSLIILFEEQVNI